MSSDWDAFRETSFWNAPRRAKVDVGSPQRAAALGDSVAGRFPSFAKLLAAARVTPVSIDGNVNYLYGWTTPEDVSLGWLSPPPIDAMDAAAAPFCDDHRVLAASFGGIGERWNEPETTWLLNLHGALTTGLAREPVDLSGYEWAFKTDDRMPINATDWYTIALEANGNLTICHRYTGELLRCATDHSSNYLVPLEGCPDYTLYRIRGAPTFTTWVERVAMQWLASIR